MGLLLICHIFHIKIWYEWWKGFVGVPNKSPKAKNPNFFNYGYRPKNWISAPAQGESTQCLGFFGLKPIFAIFVVQQKNKNKKKYWKKIWKCWKTDFCALKMTFLGKIWPWLDSYGNSYLKKFPKLFLPGISTSNMPQNGPNSGPIWSF